MSKMTRKEFLKKGALATAAGAFVTACASGENQASAQEANINMNQTFEWKCVTTWPPNFPVFGEGANKMAEWVKKMSGGRLDITVYGGGELVPPLEAFDTVSQGAAEMGTGAAYYWAGKAPAAQFFASVPFGMNAQQMNAWILSGGGLALWEEVYAPFNLMPLPAGNSGIQMGGWFNKEINTLADFKGLKMRIPGLGGKVLNKVGGTAINVAGGEIYTNLETGVIDATEWVGPYHDYKMGFADIAKYYYSPGWHEPGTQLEAFINKDAYASLPEDLQEILRVGIHYMNIWTLAEFEAKNNDFLQKLKTEKNVEMRQFSPEILNELRNATKEVIADVTASDPMSKKVYDAYSAFQTKMIDWSTVTEKAFYNTIQAT
ncbi:MAG: TRAP transporter substrate-binding protein [Bacteroidota bacterium]